MMAGKEEIAEYFMNLQDAICNALETEDANGAEGDVVKFKEDKWTREEGGGGRTRIFQDGNVIEKGGVNFSAVHGEVPQFLKTEVSTESKDAFYATGVSIVIHPKNPMVPIIHMNVRYFEMTNGVWWFGGGIDLTPHYVVDEDAAYFHRVLKSVCDKHKASYYKDFKKWADDYFYIPHRNETRGVGGIFFDRLTATEGVSKEDLFAFVKSVGEAFSPVYTHFMSKNKNLPFTEKNKKWQLLRRGRYVEFNLVYDKGTKFGLETNGRIESILMSLPALAGWEYNMVPDKNSEEEKTLSLLKKGLEWAK